MAAGLDSPALPVSDFEGDPLVKMMQAPPGRSYSRVDGMSTSGTFGHATKKRLSHSPLSILFPLEKPALFAACCNRLARTAVTLLQCVPVLDTRTLGRNPGTKPGLPLVLSSHDEADGLYLDDHHRAKSFVRQLSLRCKPNGKWED
jgi:hypothetical protein